MGSGMDSAAPTRRPAVAALIVLALVAILVWIWWANRPEPYHSGWPKSFLLGAAASSCGLPSSIRDEHTGSSAFDDDATTPIRVSCILSGVSAPPEVLSQFSAERASGSASWDDITSHYSARWSTNDAGRLHFELNAGR